MKKFLLLLVLCLSSTFSGFSQEKMNKISVNSLYLFAFGVNNIEYERAFNDGKYGVSFYIGRTGNSVPSLGDYKVYSATQSFSFKIYREGFSQKSLWYGCSLSLSTGDVFYDLNLNKLDFPDSELDKYQENRATDISTLAVSGSIGYQYIFDSFYLNIFGGAGLALTNNLYGDAQYSGDIEESSIIPNLGISAGIAF